MAESTPFFVSMIRLKRDFSTASTLELSGLPLRVRSNEGFEVARARETPVQPLALRSRALATLNRRGVMHPAVMGSLPPAPAPGV